MLPRYHLHHASKLSSEVLEPGPWPRPAPPKHWDDGDGAFDDLQAMAVPGVEPLASDSFLRFPDPPRSVPNSTTGLGGPDQT